MKPIRNRFMMDGPIKTKTKGTKKGKKGYTRKTKHKKELA